VGKSYYSLGPLLAADQGGLRWAMRKDAVKGEKRAHVGRGKFGGLLSLRLEKNGWELTLLVLGPRCSKSNNNNGGDGGGEKGGSKELSERERSDNWGGIPLYSNAREQTKTPRPRKVGGVKKSAPGIKTLCKKEHRRRGGGGKNGGKSPILLCARTPSLKRHLPGRTGGNKKKQTQKRL